MGDHERLAASLNASLTKCSDCHGGDISSYKVWADVENNYNLRLLAFRKDGDKERPCHHIYDDGRKFPRWVTERDSLYSAASGDKTCLKTEAVEHPTLSPSLQSCTTDNQWVKGGWTFSMDGFAGQQLCMGEVKVGECKIDSFPVLREEDTDCSKSWNIKYFGGAEQMEYFGKPLELDQDKREK